MKLAAAIVRASVSSAVIFVTDEVVDGSGIVMSLFGESSSANRVNNVEYVTALNAVIERRIGGNLTVTTIDREVKIIKRISRVGG